ncbi:MAG: hypothetical protein M1827_000086 [Pycnora praestabilis]|nr:MAG: hypothetical protein M1827_000086 [Pycnora praestabilis]
MSSFLLPWRRATRRDSDSVYPGGFLPFPTGVFDCSNESELALVKKGPPTLSLITPKKSLIFGSHPPSPQIRQSSSVESANQSARSAGCVSAVNWSIRTPTASPEEVHSAALSELPASFTHLAEPAVLPAELPGSLLMENEGYSSDSLARWGKGPEKIPPSLIAVLGVQMPCSRSRTSSHNQLSSPDSTYQSVQSSSVNSPASDCYTTVAGSQLSPSDRSLRRPSHRGWRSDAMIEYRGSEAQRTDHFTSRIHELEDMVRMSATSISQLSNQLESAKLIHETEITKLRSDHFEETESLKTLIASFIKDYRASSEDVHVVQGGDNISTSIDSAALKIGCGIFTSWAARPELEGIVESYSFRRSASLTSIPESFFTRGQGHDHEQEEALRHQLYESTQREDRLTLKMAQLENQIVDYNEQLASHGQYVTELRDSLKAKDNKMVEMRLGTKALKEIIEDLEHKTGELLESRSNASNNESRLLILTKANEDLTIRLYDYDSRLKQLQAILAKKDDDYSGIVAKLVTTEEMTRLLREEVAKKHETTKVSLHLGSPFTHSNSGTINKAGPSPEPNENDHFGETMSSEPSRGSDSRINDLERQIQTHLDDIALYKLDVRGYRKDIRQRDKQILEMQQFLSSSRQNLEEISDLGSPQEWTQAMGLGIDMPLAKLAIPDKRLHSPLPPLPFATESSAQRTPKTMDAGHSTAYTARTPTSQSPSLLWRFNAAFKSDSEPVTPANQTMAQPESQGSPIRRHRRGDSLKTPIRTVLEEGSDPS